MGDWCVCAAFVDGRKSFRMNKKLLKKPVRKAHYARVSPRFINVF